MTSTTKSFTEVMMLQTFDIISEDNEKASGVYQMNLHLFSNLDPEVKA